MHSAGLDADWGCCSTSTSILQVPFSTWYLSPLGLRYDCANKVTGCQIRYSTVDSTLNMDDCGVGKQVARTFEHPAVWGNGK